MKKVWYNLYMECIKESPAIEAKLGEVICIGKIKSEGYAWIVCSAIQNNVRPYFKVYFK